MTGIAQFLDPRTIRVQNGHGEQSCGAEAFVIATGTKPAPPPKFRSTGATSSTAIRSCTMPEIPKTLIVVGGGVIGVEYTCMFATLGVRVILVEKRPRLLEFADSEMVEALSYHLRDRRVTLRLNEEVESVEETPDGGGREPAKQEEALRATRCFTRSAGRAMWTS